MNLLTAPILAAQAAEPTSAWQQLGYALRDLFVALGRNAVHWLLKLVACIVLFLLARFVLKKLIAFLGRKMDEKGAPPSVKGILLWLLNYAVTICLIVMILIALDIVKSASIAALIAAMGVGVSLALQGVIGNFAGGLLLILLKPFKEGDYIIVDTNGGIEGTVQEIHVYYTTLISVYNDKICVPNSSLTNHSVKNMMADGNKRLELHLGIGYDEDLQKALRVLEEIANEDERIFEDRRAFFVHELGAHAVILGIRVVVKREDYLQVYWDLNKNIRLRFQEEGIEIPYEQLDVHIVQEKK